MNFELRTINQYKINKMRKVSLGFKGDPDLKLELKDEAEESEMTVSEYLEAIVENRHIKDDVRMLRLKLREEKQEKDLVLKKLEGFEDRLEPLLEEYRGKELPFRKRDGIVTKILVQTPLDVLDSILSTIKSKS